MCFGNDFFDPSRGKLLPCISLFRLKLTQTFSASAFFFKILLEASVALLGEGAVTLVFLAHTSVHSVCDSNDVILLGLKGTDRHTLCVNLLDV